MHDYIGLEFNTITDYDRFIMKMYDREIVNGRVKLYDLPEDAVFEILALMADSDVDFVRTGLLL